MVQLRFDLVVEVDDVQDDVLEHVVRVEVVDDVLPVGEFEGPLAICTEIPVGIGVALDHT